MKNFKNFLLYILYLFLILAFVFVSLKIFAQPELNKNIVLSAENLIGQKVGRKGICRDLVLKVLKDNKAFVCVVEAPLPGDVILISRLTLTQIKKRNGKESNKYYWQQYLHVAILSAINNETYEIIEQNGEKGKFVYKTTMNINNYEKDEVSYGRAFPLEKYNRKFRKHCQSLH